MYGKNAVPLTQYRLIILIVLNLTIIHAVIIGGYTLFT